MRCLSTAMVVGVLCLALGCEPIERDEPAGGTSSSDPASSAAPESSPAPDASPSPAPSSVDDTADWKNVQRVHEDLNAILDATKNGDAKKLMSYMHPKILAAAPNEEMALEAMQLMLDKLGEAKMEYGDLEFLEDPQFLQSETSHFVIVPTQTTADILGNKFEFISYQFGEKNKNGGDWKYIEGSKINGETVHQWFPDFPADVQFPEVTRRTIP